MKINRSHIKSIFTAYVLWSVILVIYGSWAVLTSEFREIVSNETYRDFLVMGYAGFLIFFALGAFLAWYTQQGKSWALWLFTVYCLYRSIDTIWGVKARESMEHVTVDATDWFRGLIIAVVWVTLIGLHGVHALTNHFIRPLKAAAEFGR